MRYVSTRGKSPVLNFEETMLTGLAPDGGLYVPDAAPVLSRDQIARLHLGSYEDAAFTVMEQFVGDTFGEEEFRDLIATAYEGFGHVSRAPLKQIDDGLWLLELFHGPTLAFKDFAMQLIGQLFQTALARRGEHDVAVVLGGYWQWSLMLVLLALIGVRHPPVAEGGGELGGARVLLGWLMLLFPYKAPLPQR